MNKNMRVFETLKKVRDFERLQLPFFKSLIDLDIIVEIGYAQEQEQPLTPKKLFLLNLSSDTTVRRRLVKLVDQGTVKRRLSARDRRSTILTVSTPTANLLRKYAAALTLIFGSI